jgi:F420 biosynthesis protein FbiB-like protein
MANAWVDDAQEGLLLDAAKRVRSVKRFSEVPVLIVACISMEGSKRFPDDKSQGCERDLANQGLGAAVQNLLLAAHGMGLGACWYCAPAFCRETVRQMLNIPLEVEPQALITLGCPAEEPVVPPRKSLDEYCFWNGWGKRFVNP